VSTYCLFGEVFGSSTEAQSVLRRKFGPPFTTGGEPITGSFVLPSRERPWILAPGVDPKGLYFLEESDLPTKALWARSTTGGRWEKLPELAPELFYENHNGSMAMDFRPPISIDFGSGSGALLTKDGDTRRLFGYDPLVGIVQGPVVCQPGEKMSLGTDRVPGLKGILIRLICPEEPSRSTLFEYLPGSRKILQIGKTLDILLFYLDEEGGVWRSYEGKIWRTSPRGKVISLWPTGIGPG
jgi:hypothetical protein